jgi:N-acylneuraminate cytidylyltransferase
LKVAIITARGGSKRIPRKNIRDFHGKPIIAYVIEAALNSHIFDEVMVSTDDSEIADIAKKNGAVVPFMRDDKTSDDFATTADVLDEVLNEYKNLGKEIKSFCCIYPTAPFVTTEKLIESNKKFSISDADSLVSMVKFSFPPQRGFIQRNGNVEYREPEHKATRSQDLEPIFHDAGQFYWAKVKTFLETKFLVSKNTIGFELSESEVQDIDTENDWKIAEIKYSLLKN